MKMKKIFGKSLAVLLAALMLVSLMPLMAIADEADSDGGYVYLSISFDGKYVDDKNGDPIVYLPVALDDIAAVDLTEYGLDNMLFDSDGDGEYETTALQLLIYAHEVIYGGDWSEVTFDALPGSSYFRGGIFGFTENLVYFHNGDFPVDESQESDFMTVGATSDRIVLEAGDFIDVASFNCYSFLWDQLGGFHLFADDEGNYVHDYTVDQNETLSVRLMHSFCDLMFGESWVMEATDYEVYYGRVFGEAEGSVTTDDGGFADITFDEAGTYYVWCDGAMGSDDGTHGFCDHYMENSEPCIVSAPAYAKVTVTGDDVSEPEPELPRQPQSVEGVLNATLAQLAATVTAPSFGTSAGEWTVFSLARGGYFDKDNAYFTDYYARIVATVNELAASIDKNGGLDKSKSTENSRLIVALSAIGKDARAVGCWNLVEAYSANGMSWIQKQGLNGTIWTLIALDSNNYVTSDPTIRQQCVDSILAARHNDGGWSLTTNKTYASNVDVTCMTLTALYPYRDRADVAEACAEAIQWLSNSQLASGGFPYGSGETSESCAWAIVALTTWGIDPDTDERFIKNGNSAVDNLLSYYIESEATFEHGKGAGANAMATDQASYALVAYDRFINGETALFDYSDVTFEVVTPNVNPVKPPVEPETPENPEIPGITDDSATVTLPEKVEMLDGMTFNGTVTLNSWNADAGYKLIDLILEIPEGITVSSVSAGSRLGGGEVSFNLSGGLLRIVYFDANGGNITVSGDTSSIELFNITFALDGAVIGDVLAVNLREMSLKANSDPTDTEANISIDTEGVTASVTVVEGITFSAGILYEGDGVDLIPVDKMAVFVTVTGIDEMVKLTYNDGVNVIEFKYSAEISEKLGVNAYVALVDDTVDLANLALGENYTVGTATADSITFGDINGDGVINAQDALAAVNMWLRKGDAPTDEEILSANVNGDGRIDTYDALGIVEAFIYNDKVYAVVTKARNGQ